MYSSMALKSGGPCTFGPHTGRKLEGVRTPQDHRHWCWLTHRLSKWNDRQFADLEKWIRASCGSVDVVVAWRRSLPTFSGMLHERPICPILLYRAVEMSGNILRSMTDGAFFVDAPRPRLFLSLHFFVFLLTLILGQRSLLLCCPTCLSPLIALYIWGILSAYLFFFILVLVFCSLFVLCVCIYVCCVPIKDIGLSIYLLYRMTQASSSTDDDMMRVKVCIVIVV